MQREADAVVGHAVLREVIGANLFAAIACAHHLLALLGQFRILLFHLHFVEARAQHAHALVAILDLRLLILAAHHGVGGDMRDAHRGIGCVHRLAAGTG